MPHLFVVSDLGEIRFSIPDVLHETLKLKALREKKTLKKLVVELLWEGVKETA
jgi:predicted HicB family RNase H-like nuclease